MADHNHRNAHISPEAGLESPQFLARLGIDRQDVAVGIAAEDEASGRRCRPTPLTDAIGRLVLPDDLVGVAADCGKGAAHPRADRRRLGTIRVAQPH
jgi:hypothetical protein